MTSNQPDLLSKVKVFLEDLLALRVSESERIHYAGDALLAFYHEPGNQRPLRVAAVLAVLFHIFLFLFMFPSFGRQILTPTKEVLVLKNLAAPAALQGGSPPEPAAAPPTPKETIPKPEPILVPIPDPTPHAPEPIRKKEEEIPNIMREIAADLNIGDITAPPGPPSRPGEGRGPEGTGAGPSTGPGPAAGSGDGPYVIGSGVTNPVLITQTRPSYTDEAIRAKVQGVVLLQAVIRRDGTVGNFKVLRGLGYGLEEKAIQEIANNWKFRPGTLNGKPVDVLATIEIQFSLR